MMILTCPQCATRFFVERERIAAAGRRVKCDACSAVWVAYRGDDAEAAADTADEATIVDTPEAAEALSELQPEPPSVGEDAPTRVEPAVAPEPMTSPAPIEPIAMSPLAGEEESPPLFTERRVAPAPAKAGNGRLVFGIILLVLIIVAVMIGFKPQMERAFPGAASLYGDAPQAASGARG